MPPLRPPSVIIAGAGLAGLAAARSLERGGARATVLEAGVRSIRGFFLADPEDLSLLALVDQFSEGVPGDDEFYRIPGGNDRLPERVATELRSRIILRAVVQEIGQADGRVTMRFSEAGTRQQIEADYAGLHERRRESGPRCRRGRSEGRGRRGRRGPSIAQ